MEGHAPSWPNLRRTRRSASLQYALCAALVCAALEPAQPVRADVGPAIQPVAVVSDSTHGTIKANRCNVRSRPHLTAEVVVQLNKGDTIEVLERKSVTDHEKTMEWFRINLPAYTKCFVSTKLLTGGAANADNVNIRCGPGTNFRDIGRLIKSAKVEAVATKGDWTQIKPTPDCSGWIAGELVDIKPAAVPAAAPASETSMNAPVVVTPPVAVPRTPAPAAPATTPPISVVNIDPDVQVQYVVKEGYLWAATGTNAPAAYELRTPEEDLLSHRMAYVEISNINPKKYMGRPVRIQGNQRWHKGDRDPVIVAERIDIIW